MAASDGKALADWRNEVHLLGRVSAAAQERELPSGDVVLLFRLVVPRVRRPGLKGTATVDTIDVACWASPARRAAARLEEGDLAEVTGALRRRFFRTGSGAASRYEVEASAVRRSRPAPRTGPRTGRA
jgi:single-strand DNA-binding protein